MTDDDDDELDFEEFMSMSDAQADALHDRLMKEYGEMLDRMTPRQLYQYRRQRTLNLILKQRRLAKEFPGIDIFQTHLRSSQRRLLTWRIEYRTGVRAGHA